MPAESYLTQLRRQSSGGTPSVSDQEADAIRRDVDTRLAKEEQQQQRSMLSQMKDEARRKTQALKESGYTVVHDPETGEAMAQTAPNGERVRRIFGSNVSVGEQTGEYYKPDMKSGGLTVATGEKKIDRDGRIVEDLGRGIKRIGDLDEAAVKRKNQSALLDSAEAELRKQHADLYARSGNIGNARAAARKASDSYAGAKTLYGENPTDPKESGIVSKAKDEADAANKTLADAEDQFHKVRELSGKLNQIAVHRRQAKASTLPADVEKQYADIVNGAKGAPAAPAQPTPAVAAAQPAPPPPPIPATPPAPVTPEVGTNPTGSAQSTGAQAAAQSSQALANTQANTPGQPAEMPKDATVQPPPAAPAAPAAPVQPAPQAAPAPAPEVQPPTGPVANPEDTAAMSLDEHGKALEASSKTLEANSAALDARRQQITAPMQVIAQKKADWQARSDAMLASGADSDSMWLADGTSITFAAGMKDELRALYKEEQTTANAIRPQLEALNSEYDMHRADVAQHQASLQEYQSKIDEEQARREADRQRVISDLRKSPVTSAVADRMEQAKAEHDAETAKIEDTYKEPAQREAALKAAQESYKKRVEGMSGDIAEAANPLKRISKEQDLATDVQALNDDESVGMREVRTPEDAKAFGEAMQKRRQELQQRYGVTADQFEKVAASVRSRPYSVDEEGNLQFTPASGKDDPTPDVVAKGFEAAVKDGVLDESKVGEMRQKLDAAKAEWEKVVAEAGDNAKAKAALRGALKGGAFIGGATLGTPLGAKGGAALATAMAGPEAAPVGAAVGGTIGALTGGTIASAGADKLLNAAGRYVQAINSINQSAAVHPGYAQTGELAAFIIAPEGLTSPKLFVEKGIAAGLKPAVVASIENYAKLGSIAADGVGKAGASAAVDSARAVAAADAVLKSAAGSVGGAVAFTGAQYLFDAGRYAVADLAGIKHDQLHAPGFADLATNVGLGLLLHGRSLTFRDYSPAEVASILTRAKVRNDAGIDLKADATPDTIIRAFKDAGVDLDASGLAEMGRPLTAEDVAVYESAKRKTKELQDSGEFANAGVEFGGAVQGNIPDIFGRKGKGTPIASSVVNARPNERMGGGGEGEAPKPGAPTGGQPAALPEVSPEARQAASDTELQSGGADSEAVRKATVLRDIGNGADLRTMTEADLNTVGLTHKGGDIKPLTGRDPRTGQPYTPSVQVDDKGRAIILQPAIDDLRANFPATSQLVTADETQIRQRYADADKVRPANDQPANAPATGSVVPRDSSSGGEALPAASGKGNSKGAAPSGLKGAAPAPELERSLTPTGGEGDKIRKWGSQRLHLLKGKGRTELIKRIDMIATELDAYSGKFSGGVVITNQANHGKIFYSQKTDRIYINPVKMLKYLDEAKNDFRMQSVVTAALDEEYKHQTTSDLYYSDAQFRLNLDKVWDALPDELKALSAESYFKREGARWNNDEIGKFEFFRQYWQRNSTRKLTETALREKGLIGALRALLARFIRELQAIAKGTKHPELKAILDRLIAQGEEYVAALKGTDAYEARRRSKVANMLRAKAEAMEQVGGESAVKQAEKLREKADKLEEKLKVAETPSEEPSSPSKVETVDEQAHEAATSPKNDLAEPTDAQKEAGNYPKGHVTLAGMDISIENPAGSKRRPEWPELRDHYGYFRGTVGRDKDHVDVFIKPGTPLDYEGPVFVVNQVDPSTRKFDETKVIIGATDKNDAYKTYRRNYSENWKGYDSLAEFPDVASFKEWLYNGDHSKKVSNPGKAETVKTGEGPKTDVPQGTTPFPKAPEGTPTTNDIAKDAAAVATGEKPANVGAAVKKVIPDKPKTKLTNKNLMTALRGYFTPGAIVPGYGGQDRVVAFHGDSPANWNVDVVAVDKEGRDIPGERVRNHRTMPKNEELLKVLNRPEEVSNDTKPFTPDVGKATSYTGHLVRWMQERDQRLASVPQSAVMKTVMHVVHAAVMGEYTSMLHPDNKMARKLFSELTGVKLPASVGATQAVFTGFPIDITHALETKGGISHISSAGVRERQMKELIGKSVLLPDGTKGTVMQSGITVSRLGGRDTVTVQLENGKTMEVTVPMVQGRPIIGDAPVSEHSNPPAVKDRPLPNGAIGTNAKGQEITKDDKGARSVRINGNVVQTQAVEIVPTRGPAGGIVYATKIKTPRELYDDGQHEYLTKQELEQFSKTTSPTDGGQSKGGAGNGSGASTSTSVASSFETPVKPNISQPAKPATPPKSGASAATIAKGRAAFEGLQAPGTARLETSNPAGQQIGLPRERRGQFMDLADSLIEDGITEPSKLVQYLNEIRPDGALQKYAQALWNYIGTADPSLSGTHDWASLQSGLDSKVVTNDTSTDEPAGESSSSAENPVDETGGRGLSDDNAGSAGNPQDAGSDLTESTGGAEAGGSGEGIRPLKGGRSVSGGKRTGGKAKDDVRGSEGGDVKGADTNDNGAGETGNPAPKVLGRSNYHLTDPEAIVGGSQRVRFDRNKKAITTYEDIISENRDPRPDELDTLAGYTGWGAFGQELFNGSWDHPAPKPGWEDADQWLRDNLGEQAWKSAQGSIINAHYTDPPTIGSMWGMIRKMGFKGGRTLEPSIGIGNFFTMMPRDLEAASSLTGIELDHMTGRIAQMLLPQANVQIKGYQSSQTSDNFYDLVIGNWPFAKDGPADRRFNHLNLSLHDYFFAKALAQVRPGGIVMGITSSGTMDKKSAVARRYLASQAELVAAFRLPSGAFEKYAGTKVVTDIIILRKRQSPISDVSGEGWIDVVQDPLKRAAKDRQGKETPLFYNQYYHTHPANIIGTIGIGHGTTFGRAGMIVERHDDFAEQLASLPERVPADAFKPFESGQKPIEHIANTTSITRQNAIVEHEGDLWLVNGEQLTPLHDVAKWKLTDANKTAKRLEETRGLMKLRDAYDALMLAYKGDTDEGVSKARESLNDAYKAFFKKHGSPSESSMARILSAVNEPSIGSLMNLDEFKDGKWQPRAILVKDIMRRTPASAKGSIEDAYALQRNNSTTFDLDEVARLAEKPVEQVKQRLMDLNQIFQLPTGVWETRDTYLAGPVRQKMREAEDAQERGMDMSRNIEALRQVIPPDTAYFDIEVKMGAAWITRDDYKDFIKHLLHAGDEDVQVAKMPSGWDVKISGAPVNSANARNVWGTGDSHPSRTFQAAMNGTALTVKREDSQGRVYTDKKATDELNAKVEAIREELPKWLWSDPLRTGRLTASYNELKNSDAIPKRDGSHLRLEGLALALGDSPFAFRKHQMDAVWRGIIDGRIMAAHEVGTGKTFTMAGLAVEGRRLGVLRKTILFAHNANHESVAADFRKAYPSGRFLHIDDLSPAKRDSALRLIANDDWDCIIVPHSLIERFSLREDTMRALAQKDIEALENEIYSECPDLETVDLTDAEAVSQAVGRREGGHTAKELVKARNRIVEGIIKRAQKAMQSSALFFEDLGVDAVMVDEAHIFKKIALATRKQIKGLNKTQSDAGFSLSLLTDYVKSQNNGRGVFLFTGTPVTNTLNEVYNMMRFVMDDRMLQSGISSFDDWFNDFADTTTEAELTSGGTYEPTERLLAFINVPELARLAGQHFDVVQAKDMPEFTPRASTEGYTDDPIGRPTKKIVPVICEMSPEQQAHADQIKRRYQDWQKSSGMERRRRMLTGGDTPIKMESDGSKSALDHRFYDRFAPDFAGSKLNQMVSRVLAHYHEHPSATQMIFMEQGVNDWRDVEEKHRDGNGFVIKDANNKPIVNKYRLPTFNLVRDIIEKLVADGVQPDEIAIFANQKLDPASQRPDDVLRKVRRVSAAVSKEDLAALMREGKVRVAIGGTQTMGTGVNAQDWLRAMHHLDAPWTPGEMEQRNGRGHRQGNRWNTVMEYRYFTEGSHDGKRWQTLLNKVRFIHRFTEMLRNGGNGPRVLEGEGTDMSEGGEIANFEESFSAAAGDPRLLVKALLQKAVEKLMTRRNTHARAIQDASDGIERSNRTIKFLDEQTTAFRKDADAFARWREQPFSIEVRKRDKFVTFDKREDADNAIAGQPLQIRGSSIEIARFGEFSVIQRGPAYSDSQAFEVKGPSGKEYELGSGSMASIEGTLRGLAKRIQNNENQVASERVGITAMRELLQKPFAREEELKLKQEALARIEAELAHSPKPAPSWLRHGAPQGSLIYLRQDDGSLKAFDVMAHRWDANNYWLLIEDDNALVPIPYTDALDESGSRLLPDYEFKPPTDKKPDTTQEQPEDAGEVKLPELPAEVKTPDGMLFDVPKKARGLWRQRQKLRMLIDRAERIHEEKDNQYSRIETLKGALEKTERALFGSEMLGGHSKLSAPEAAGSQPTDADEIRALYDALGVEMPDDAVLNAMLANAAGEAPGEKVTGDQILANMGMSEEARIADRVGQEVYRDLQKSVTIPQIREAAAELLKKDAAGVERSVLEAYAEGRPFEDAVLREAAKMLFNRKVAEAANSGDMAEAAKFSTAYHAVLGEVARILGTARDSMQTPRERAQDFILENLSTPMKVEDRIDIEGRPSSVQKSRRIADLEKQIEDAEGADKKALTKALEDARRQLSKEEQTAKILKDQTAEIKKALKQAGNWTIDDVTGRRVQLRAAFGQLVVKAIGEGSAKREHAVDMIVHGFPTSEIARFTGYSPLTIDAMRDTLRENPQPIYEALADLIQSGKNVDELASMIRGNVLGAAEAAPEGEKAMSRAEALKQAMELISPDDIKQLVPSAKEAKGWKKVDRQSKAKQKASPDAVADRWIDRLATGSKKEHRDTQDTLSKLIQQHRQSAVADFVDRAHGFGIDREKAEKLDALITDARQTQGAKPEKSAVQRAIERLEKAGAAAKPPRSPDALRDLINQHRRTPMDDFTDRLRALGVPEGEAQVLTSLMAEDAKRRKLVRDARKESSKKPTIEWNPLEEEYLPFDAEDEGHVVKMARAVGSPNTPTLDMVQEFWINSLLSGTKTLFTINNIGNITNGLMEMMLYNPIERALGAVAQAGAKAVGGEYYNELTPRLLEPVIKGAMRGFATGIMLANKAFVEERDVFDHTYGGESGHGIGGMEKYDNQGAIPGLTGKILRTPSRILLWEDQVFKTTLAHVEVGRRAYRRGLAEGLRGGKLAAYVDSQVNDPASIAWVEAARFADEVALQDHNAITDLISALTARGGDTRRRLEAEAMKQAKEGDMEGARKTAKRIRQLWWREKIGKFIIPFSTVASNIFRYFVKRSPIGTFTHLLPATVNAARGRGAKGDVVRHLASQLVAWSAYLLLRSMVEGDKDDDKKRVLLVGSAADGRRDLVNRTQGGTNRAVFRSADGARIGVLDFSRIEYAGTVLSSMIDAIRLEKTLTRAGTDKAQQAAQVLLGMVASMASRIEDQPFMRGPAQVARVLDSAQKASTAPGAVVKSGQRLLTDILGGFDPNIVRATLRDIDPKKRDYNNAEWWYSLVPHESGAHPMIDLNGREQIKEGNAITRLLWPAGIQTGEVLPSDKWLEEFNRDKTGNTGIKSESSYYPRKPAPGAYSFKDTKGKQVPMTADQREAFDRRAGELYQRLLGTESKVTTEEPTGGFTRSGKDAKRRVVTPVPPLTPARAESGNPMFREPMENALEKARQQAKQEVARPSFLTDYMKKFRKP